MTVPDLRAARAAVETTARVVDGAVAHLGRRLDDDQAVAYDVAHAAAGTAAARSMLRYGTLGEVESRLAEAYVADLVHDVACRMLGRAEHWGARPGALDEAVAVVAKARDPANLADLAHIGPGPRHLDDDHELVADTFRRFADDRIRRRAEQVHRTNADVPEEVISGLAELGAFGLSVPEAYGGFAAGDERDHLAMVVATEELSRASLGIGGSLITRPEILTRALVRGGTDAQKRRWLPRIAAGEELVAVAVTEPDHGSDVARLRTTARRSGEGWVITGTKTWCTFAGRADVLMLLARSDADQPGHRGLSLFMVSKPRGYGHGFDFSQDRRGGAPGGGRMQGRAIDTIGYRGMHSYEIALDEWWVPADALVGERSGEGRGFHLTMEGFETGRLQTAARAVGLMQAAYEAARSYASDRWVFGSPVGDYQLTRVKLARMALLIQAGRQLVLDGARAMGETSAGLQAAMVKAYACRVAEWVTREAMQIHGGMGYAEEYEVSRLFVDARVLSIFEGSDEILCLKVIMRRLTAA
ncbi:MAG: acyl-CoA dehydrogenase family protein [Acidimicrobiales bacterium]